MPLPTPRRGEGRDGFIGRCMGADVTVRDFPRRDRRLAVCARQWDEHRMSGTLQEQEVSTRDWSAVDKSKLPACAFLVVPDRERRSTWKLPYREGAGPTDDDGRFRRCGPVNLNGLRAAASAVAGARTGRPMSIPAAARRKLDRLLRQHNIGENRQSRELTEQMTLSAGQLDKQARVVHDVAILRPESRNGRYFTRRALESTAALAEGAKVYLNHTTPTESRELRGARDVLKLAGYIENARVEEPAIVRGDLHYGAVHAQIVESLVEDFADKIGLSVHAFGPMDFDEERNQERVVDISELRSVDIVSDTGSTKNLFESRERPGEEPEEEESDMEFSEITLAELRQERPDLVREITESTNADARHAKELADLKEQVKGLTEERDGLRQKVDEYQVREALQRRKDRVSEMIVESKIGKELVTDVFRETLESAVAEDGSLDEQRVRRLIDDRKGITKGVRGVGASREVDESEHRPTTISDDQVIDIVRGSQFRVAE